MRRAALPLYSRVGERSCGIAIGLWYSSTQGRLSVRAHQVCLSGTASAAPGAAHCLKVAAAPVLAVFRFSVFL